ncbi:uncharacterized protein LOC125239470 [Leguminivora glycinivorella]|uniref:uncharacterized protein LOC125239470 n=1 Tax=Leguminivora glycinivorella TaxID=1035111 RepID=UPI0020104A32|nr:uncharacterized protein LOC125239470 [Leguminivora glycinivorella]
MFILLLCLALVTNSRISVQAESTTQTTLNDTNVKNTNSPATSQNDETIKKPSLQLNQNNSEVILSFNKNTTALIKELKTTVENLIEHLEKTKTTPKPHQSIQDSIYNYFPKILRKRRAIENVTGVRNDSNMIHVDVKMDKEKNVENVTEANIEKNNVTDADDDSYDWLSNSDNSTEASNTTEVSGRRSFSSDMEIAKVVRTRLLSYVHEHISDTMNKIDSLKSVKNAYATNNIFNIGYIMANIDLIEKNLKKLREGINESNKDWAEAHILDVFDKVKYTNNVMTSLMSALKSIFNATPNNGVLENLQGVYGK